MTTQAGGSVVGASALIGAFAAISVVFLRDYLFRRAFLEYEERWKGQNKYRAYAAPLTQAVVSLMYRLDEIINSQRNHFLSSKSPGSKYNVYKFCSTAYRLAAMLSYFRILDIETAGASLRMEDQEVSHSIQMIRSTLSDGVQVEQRLVHALCDLYGVSKGQPQLSVVAADISQHLYDVMHNKGLSSLHEIRDLEDYDKIHISEIIKNRLVGAGLAEAASDKMQNTSPTEVCDLISVREWWIYRDWQDAIGNKLICKGESGSRRLEVVGYDVFYEMFYKDPENPKSSQIKDRWLEALAKLILDLGKTECSRDARQEQIRSLLKAVAGLVVSLHASYPNSRLMPDNVVAKARQLSQVS